MKKTIVLLFASAATLLAQPVVPGAWTITGDVEGHPINEACSFTQDQEKISGVCKNDEGKSYNTTVTVAEKKVTFVHGGEYQGDALTLTFTGSWNDKGELTGDIAVAPLDVSGTFLAKKADTK
ncbi:MAG TPA: hypothetical protein VK593_08270 [Edaphobacter sp.]|nr:hypothetical protein [Edaphobacter sp.]